MPQQYSSSMASDSKYGDTLLAQGGAGGGAGAGMYSGVGAGAKLVAASTGGSASGAGGGASISSASGRTGGAARSFEVGWKDIDVSEIEMGDRIGGGGFALVHRAVWNGERVAVKALFDPKVDDALKAEFMDELHVMRRLSHQNIVKFLGACCKAPKLCFVMELCTGSLYGLLHNSTNPVNDAMLVDMALDVARGMAYLHSRKPAIIHRDLKSHNVLLKRDKSRKAGYTLKLCDFGLVQTRHTTAGTPAYMAPELLNNKPFSKSCDVYAYGILLFELFTRSIPFDGWRVTDIRDTVIAGGRPEWPRGQDCPKLVRSIMKQCLYQHAAKRPSFDEIVPALESWKPKVSHVAKATGGDSLDALLST